MIPAVDHDLAVDHHGGDTDCVTMRVLVRRAIGDPGGIEHGYIRPRTRPQPSAIPQAEGPSGDAGHLGDRRLQGEQAEVAHARTQHVRVGAVVTRVGLALAGDTGTASALPSEPTVTHGARVISWTSALVIDVMRTRVSPRSATT